MENIYFDIALRIVKKLQKQGFEAVFAGGAVRDRLLGIEAQDIDVATNASADQICNIFPNSGKVGKVFGVVLVKNAGMVIEVASFRQDGPYSDGRRPDWVKPASMQQDAERRDFTINGMFYDPVKDKIIDFVGGKKDLERKTIQAIGKPEQRFAEDYLRMFRAVRFAVRLDFEIENKTYAQIKRLSPKVELIAAERVREEIGKIICSFNNDRGLQILADSGLLDYWLPEVKAMIGVEQSEIYHPEGDCFEHTKKALLFLENPGTSLAWATLLHDAGKPLTTIVKDGRIVSPRHAYAGGKLAERICERLKFSNRDAARIKSMVETHMNFVEYPKMREATKKRLLAMEGFGDHLKLHRADVLASNGNLETYNRIVTRLQNEDVKKLPKALVNGDDLISLGFKPGPMFKKILDDVCEKQLEGELTSRIDALDYVMNIWHKSENRN